MQYSVAGIAACGVVLAWSVGCNQRSNAAAADGPQSGRSGGSVATRGAEDDGRQLSLQDGVSLADVAALAAPSVVNVSTTRQRRGSPFDELLRDPAFRRYFRGRVPRPSRRLERSLGSGVIVGADGTVLTNHHVIAGAESITVAVTPDRLYSAAVVGTDPQSDLAVLRLEGDFSELQPIAFADSDAVRVGDVVLAIGDPFGIGETVTMGIVSAKGRAHMGIAEYEDLLQTDAAINPGNSGGALVDTQGRLVGVNIAILSRTGGFQGIGFAIPSRMAQPIMQVLIDKGELDRGWLGVGVQDIDRDLAEAMGLGTEQGALIGFVEPGSPADDAGLQSGDVVLEVDGAPVESAEHLRSRIGMAEAGTEVRLEVLRDGRRDEVPVTLGKLPRQAEDPGIGEPAPPAAQTEELGGLKLVPLDRAARERFNLPSDLRSGVVIVDVAPGSAADRAGLQPGDVIVQADRKPVGSVEELDRVYRAADELLALRVRRGEGAVYIALRKES